MKTVVLKGGIACGKSLAGRFFRELGCVFIDADKVVHRLYRQKKIQALLAKNFGRHMIKKNRVDRKALSGIVFSDKKKLKKLNSIAHPPVFAELEKILSRYKKTKKNVVFEIPVFSKARAKLKPDFVVTVYCSRKKQLSRLEKKGMEKKEALARINSLPSRKPKTGFLIENNKGNSNLKKQVKKVFEIIKKKFKYKYV